MPNIYIKKAKIKAQRLHVRFLKQQVIRGNINVLVCSPGGVGSSFFIAFLEKYKSVNSYKDRDGLKHIDRPPLTLNSNLKAIYIYGEYTENLLMQFFHFSAGNIITINQKNFFLNIQI